MIWTWYVLVHYKATSSHCINSWASTNTYVNNRSQHLLHHTFINIQGMEILSNTQIGAQAETMDVLIPTTGSYCMLLIIVHSCHDSYIYILINFNRESTYLRSVGATDWITWELKDCQNHRECSTKLGRSCHCSRFWCSRHWLREKRSHVWLQSSMWVHVSKVAGHGVHRHWWICVVENANSRLARCWVLMLSRWSKWHSECDRRWSMCYMNHVSYGRQRFALHESVYRLHTTVSDNRNTTIICKLVSYFCYDNNIIINVIQCCWFFVSPIILGVIALA